MADELDVTADFDAHVGDFLANLDLAINAAERFRDMIFEDIAAIEAMHEALDDLPTEHLTNVSLVGEDEILEQVAEIREYIDALPDERTILVNMGTGTPGDRGTGGYDALAQAMEDAARANEAFDAAERDTIALTRDGRTALDELANAYDLPFGSVIQGQRDVAREWANSWEEAGTLNERLDGLTSKMGVNGEAVRSMAADYERLHNDTAATAGDMNILADSLARTGQDADGMTRYLGAAGLSAADLAARADAAAARLRGAGQAAAAAGNAAGGAALGWGLLTHNFQLWAGAFGNTPLIGHIKGWHIALDALLESAIALLPALIDLGAGLAAMQPAATDIYNHLTAVHDVSVALGQTIPPLNGWFENLQHQMAPQTVEAFGGALSLVNSQTGGLAHIIGEVVTGIDDWIARLDLYMASQHGLNGVLQSGVGFLHQFMIFVDDVGKAFVNLVKADPGTAHFLMDAVDGFGKLLDIITSIPTPILAFVLGLHSIDIWGGLAVSAIKNMVMPLIGFGQSALQVAAHLGVFGNAGKAAMIPLNDLRTAEGQAAVASTSLWGKLSALASSPWTWAIVGAALIGGIAYEMTQADGATKSFIANLNSGLANMPASQAILQINNDIRQLNDQIPQVGTHIQQMNQGASASLTKLGKDWEGAFGALKSGDVGDAFAKTWAGVLNVGVSVAREFGLIGAAMHKTADINAYEAATRNLTNQQKNLFTETGNLMRQGYSYSQSLGLLDLAGVQAADKMSLIRQKVDNLIAGYKAMSIQGAVLTGAVDSVTFAAEQQNSKIGALTQGISTWLSTITGGESSLISFAQGMDGLTQAASGATTTLSLSNGKTSLSTSALTSAAGAAKAAGVSMDGLSTNSLQLRSAFEQQIIAAGNTYNSLMTLVSAAGQGKAGTQVLVQATKDMVASLIPFTAGSKQAQSQVLSMAQAMGYNGVDSFQALTQWVGKIADPMGNLNTLMGNETILAGNLAKDMQNLAEAINTNLNQAMSLAVLSANHTQKAFNDAATAIQNAHGNITKMLPSMKTLGESVYQDLGGNVKATNNELTTFMKAFGLTPSQIKTILSAIDREFQQTASSVVHHLETIQQEIDSLHGKTVTITAQLASGGTVPGVTPGIPVGVAAPKNNAAGTPSASPGWSWVGEAGPELVRFHGGETVVPNHAVGGYAGGAGWYDSGGYFPGLAPVLSGASGGSSGGGGASAGGAQPLHVHLMLNGREMAEAVLPDLVGAANRYSLRSSGKATGLLRPS